jgi:hypothetical protein
VDNFGKELAGNNRLALHISFGKIGAVFDRAKGTDMAVAKQN